MIYQVQYHLDSRHFSNLIDLVKKYMNSALIFWQKTKKKCKALRDCSISRSRLLYIRINNSLTEMDFTQDLQHKDVDFLLSAHHIPYFFNRVLYRSVSSVPPSDPFCVRYSF